MAANAISLQLRRNTKTNITLIRNPSSVQLFSSSSLPEPPPHNADDDETTSSPPPPQSQSQSQSQSSFTSYFSDLKSSLKQPQQQQSPFQRQQSPFQRQQSPFPQYSNHVPQSAGPSKAASFEEIRKNLSEFRSRTAAPPPPGINSPSSFQSPPPRATSNISFQELFKKNIMSRGDLSNNTDSSSSGKGAKFSYDVIRESIKQLRQNKSVEANRGNHSANRSKLTDSLFGPAKSWSVYGGTGSLPAKVFGKESNRKTEGESGEMKTKFLKMYTYGDLGEKLKMLRPEEAKKKTGKWFSLKELSERLIKLRELEEEESDSRVGPLKDIRESLEKLSSQETDKKKLAIHRVDLLGQLGGTPNYMLSPPKENLVEKYFHPDNMSSAEKMKIELQKVRDEFKMSESDCGSSRVQVAQLTTKIKHLSATLHKKDKHSRKGLQAMVQRRKKLLKYLRRTDWDSYCLVLDKLGLRDNPDYKN